MLSDLVAVVLAESFTCTVKFDAPAAVGVPEIVPPAARVRPAGSDPVTDCPDVPARAAARGQRLRIRSAYRPRGKRARGDG